MYAIRSYYDSWPNFNLWASYRFRDDNLPDGGTDFVSAGFGMTLPLWREKRAEEVAAADSGIVMARQQLTEFANQVDAGIDRVFVVAEGKASEKRIRVGRRTDAGVSYNFV